MILAGIMSSYALEREREVEQGTSSRSLDLDASRSFFLVILWRQSGSCEHIKRQSIPN